MDMASSSVIPARKYAWRDGRKWQWVTSSPMLPPIKSCAAVITLTLSATFRARRSGWGTRWPGPGRVMSCLQLEVQYRAMMGWLSSPVHTQLLKGDETGCYCFPLSTPFLSSCSLFVVMLCLSWSCYRRCCRRRRRRHSYPPSLRQMRRKSRRSSLSSSTSLWCTAPYRMARSSSSLESLFFKETISFLGFDLLGIRFAKLVPLDHRSGRGSGRRHVCKRAHTHRYTHRESERWRQTRAGCAV